MRQITLANGRIIGDGAPTFIIAEAGSNWRMGTPARDLAMGKALIDVAVEAGADAVKFQTYKATKVYVKNAGESEYLAEAGIKEDIISIFEDLAMPYEMIGKLAAYCEQQGILFMSSPFSVADFEAVDPYTLIHKVASYEISHLRLIEAVAKSGKPMLLSTGASGHADIRWAVDWFYECGGKDLILLQCTSKYPAPLDTIELNVIPTLMNTYDVISGLSDHSQDPVIAPVGAVALGGSVIEKHYTLDKRLPGPDHAFAITPDGLKQLVKAVRQMEEALGSPQKDVQDAEEELYHFARRSLQATQPIAKGDIFQEGINVDILRPGKQNAGLHPKYLTEVEGKTATRDIPEGDGIRTDDYV